MLFKRLEGVMTERSDSDLMVKFQQGNPHAFALLFETYRGRIGIHELLELNDNMRVAISQDAILEEIRKQAVAAGMITKREDGIAKANQGITTIEEVLNACA